MQLKRFFIFDDLPTHKMIIGNLFLLIFILTPLCLFLFLGQTYHWNIIWEYKTAFLEGWLVTIYISAISFLLSTTIGVICALAKRSHILLIRYFATLYIEIIRGTPLLVQILFFFYVIANGFGIENRYIVGIVTLSCFSGAYLSEIFRSGIENISASQLESAKAIGLTTFQTYRFIIIPQAVRATLPALAGQFASLIKDSSLLSIIGINEFTYTAQQINSTTYSTLESFFPLAVGYLLLTLPISLWSKSLEKKFLYAT